TSILRNPRLKTFSAPKYPPLAGSGKAAVQRSARRGGQAAGAGAATVRSTRDRAGHAARRRRGGRKPRDLASSAPVASAPAGRAQDSSVTRRTSSIVVWPANALAI